MSCPAGRPATGSGIEAVITGLTRNLLPLEPLQNLQSLVFQALNGFY